MWRLKMHLDEKMASNRLNPAFTVSQDSVALSKKISGSHSHHTHTPHARACARMYAQWKHASVLHAAGESPTAHRALHALYGAADYPSKQAADTGPLYMPALIIRRTLTSGWQESAAPHPTWSNAQAGQHDAAGHV